MAPSAGEIEQRNAKQCGVTGSDQIVRRCGRHRLTTTRGFSSSQFGCGGKTVNSGRRAPLPKEKGALFTQQESLCRDCDRLRGAVPQCVVRLRLDLVRYARLCRDLPGVVVGRRRGSSEKSVVNVELDSSYF